MSDNIKTVLMTTVIVGAIAAVALLGGSTMFSSCNAHERDQMQHQLDEDKVKAQHELDMAKAQAEVNVKRATEAIELRLKWVSSCKITPTEAEQLLPAGSGGAR